MSEGGTNGQAENVVIIGSGPAGWTAALYAARADLEPIVYEGKPKQDPSLVLPGGQLMLTTEVENYPGYRDGVTGPKMMEEFKEQAQRFGTRVRTEDIVACDFSERPFTLRTSAGETVQAQAVIISTGATANWMGLDNEKRLALSGGGVSACAVCDGALPIFREQDLAVVGGGDSAMEESLYLTKYANKVYIVHRRDRFRASKTMQDRVFANEKIEIVWNHVVEDVLGQDHVEGLQLKNTQTEERSTLPVRGLFVAIGHTPATKFLEGTGIDLDEKGYIDPPNPGRSMTNIDGVFAAGDVVDQIYRQAVTAAGMGCRAAMDAERWLGEQGLA